MKRIAPLLLLIAVAVQGFSQNEMIVAHIVNCVDATCSTCSACDCGGFDVSGANDCNAIPLICATPQTCAGAPCFTELNISSIDFTIADCDAIDHNRSLKKIIKVFAFEGDLNANVGDRIELFSDFASGPFFSIKKVGAASGIGVSLTSVTSQPSITVATGDKFEITFDPDAAGTFAATLKIYSSGCSKEISLSGEAKNPAAKDFVLALDRSGSMSDMVDASEQKINRVVTASHFFLDLLSMRTAGDRFGLVSYDDVTNTYSASGANLIAASVANVSTAKTTFLKTGASSDPLQPRNTTGIGGALEASLKVLHGVTAGNVGPCPSATTDPLDAENKILVLLTDGLENVSPFVDCALGTCLSDNCLKQAFIYSIGFGNNGDINEAMLASLPGKSAISCSANPINGYHRVNTSIAASTTGRNDLNMAYLKIFNASSDLSQVIDPTTMVTFTGGEKVINSAFITTSDQNALFVVFEIPQYKNRYELKLLTPKGLEVVPGNITGGLVADVVVGNGYRIYKVNFKNATDANAFSGVWNLKFIPEKTTPSDKRDTTSVIPIGFAASVFSDINMQTSIAASQNTPGSEIIIGSDVYEMGLPTRVTDMSILITTPSGKQYPLKAVRDSFGKLIARFQNTFEAGTYTVFARASIENSRKEFTTREETKFIVIERPGSRQVLIQDKCNPCVWICIGIAAIVILIIIFILLRRRKVKTT